MHSRQHSASKRAASPVLPGQHPGTPDLPPAASANDDEVPYSSPTPGSKDQDPQAAQLAVESSLSSLLELNSSSDVDPPSSPPQQQSSSHQDVSRRKAQRESKESTGNEVGNAAGLETSRADNVDCINETHLQTPPSGSKRKRGSQQPEESQRRHSSGNKKRQTASPSSSARKKTKSVLPVDQSSPTAERAVPASSGKERSSVSDDQDRVDIIPDSFSDELEQQIASQLEQDLELSLQAEHKDEHEDVPARSTRMQKRRRGENDDPAPFSQRKKVVTAGENLPAVSSIHRAPDEDVNPDREMDNSHNSDSKKKKKNKPRRKNKASSQQKEQQQSQPASNVEVTTEPDPPPATKRRSSRLKRQPAEDEASEPLPTASQEPQDNDNNKATGAAEDPEIEAADANDLSQQSPTEDPGQIAMAMVQGLEAETVPEAPVASASSILSSLTNIRGSMKSVSFDKSTLREIDELMFDIKMEAHDAVKRHNS